jgi:hypothetical protein
LKRHEACGQHLGTADLNLRQLATSHRTSLPQRTCQARVTTMLDLAATGAACAVAEVAAPSGSGLGGAPSGLAVAVTQ